MNIGRVNGVRLAVASAALKPDFIPAAERDHRGVVGQGAGGEPKRLSGVLPLSCLGWVHIHPTPAEHRATNKRGSKERGRGYERRAAGSTLQAEWHGWKGRGRLKVSRGYARAEIKMSVRVTSVPLPSAIQRSS